MDTVDMQDGELAVRLRRLDAATHDAAPAFDYPGLLQRHVATKARARRRQAFARGTAGGLFLVMVLGSVWRFAVPEQRDAVVLPETSLEETAAQPSLVRADTYLALAALEDHIATIDDALNDARVFAPRGAEVARLERARAELMDSYTRVRYADMVSANF